MPKLKVVIEPVHTDVLPGEELWVEASIENADEEPVSVPEMPSQAPSPFKFEIHDAESGQLVYAISQESYRIAMAGDDIVDSDAPLAVELPPGERLTVTEDIAGYATQGFAPGRYQLTGIYRLSGRETRSEAVPIQVSRPKYGVVARIYCQALSVFATVFENLGFQDNVTLYERETHTANPENGVFRRRIDRGGTRKFDDLAVAAYTYWEGEGRWFAWLVDKKITGAKTWGHALTAQSDPHEIVLDNAQFTCPAFQLSDESGLFPIVGSGPDGAQVQLVKLGYERCEVMPPAPLCSMVPWSVRACFDGSEEIAPILMIWDEKVAGASRIYRRRYSIDGRSVDGSPELVYERSSQLLSYEVDSFVESAEGDECLLHALFGPEDSDDKEIVRQQVVYVVIDPSKPGRPHVVRRITVPEKPVDMWAISANQRGVHVVVVRCDGNLLWATSDSGGWQLLRSKVDKIEKLRLFAADEHVWAQWVEPGKSIMSMLVPAK